MKKDVYIIYKRKFIQRFIVFVASVLKNEFLFPRIAVATLLLVISFLFKPLR